MAAIAGCGALQTGLGFTKDKFRVRNCDGRPFSPLPAADMLCVFVCRACSLACAAALVISLSSLFLATDIGGQHFTPHNPLTFASQQPHSPSRLKSTLPSDNAARQLQAVGTAGQKYTQLDHIPETFVGDLQCSLTPASFKGKVLVSGHNHKKGEPAHCRQACRCAQLLS